MDSVCWCLSTVADLGFYEEVRPSRGGILPSGLLDPPASLDCFGRLVRASRARKFDRSRAAANYHCAAPAERSVADCRQTNERPKVCRLLIFTHCTDGRRQPTVGQTNNGWGGEEAPESGRTDAPDHVARRRLERRRVASHQTHNRTMSTRIVGRMVPAAQHRVGPLGTRRHCATVRRQSGLVDCAYFINIINQKRRLLFFFLFWMQSGIIAY